MPKLTDKKLPDSMHGFGSRLRMARKSCGVTLDALEQMSGVAAPVVSRAENGRRARTPMALSDTVRIAEALGIRLDWLVRGDGPMRGNFVTVLVEDDGPESPGIQAKLLRELSGPVQQIKRRRASSNKTD